MISARDNRRLLDRDFGQADTQRTFWLFVAVAVVFVAIGAVLFLNLQNSRDAVSDRFAAVSDMGRQAPVIGAPVLRGTYPEVVDTGEAPAARDLARIAPSAGTPGDAAVDSQQTLVQGMFGPVPPSMDDTEAAGEAVDLMPGPVRPLSVIDVDGRLVGPVVQIDPTAGVDQNIRFRLSPELAEITNYSEAFLLPLEGTDIVVLADGTYALQLDELQTRFLASYLLRVGGFE